MRKYVARTQGIVICLTIGMAGIGGALLIRSNQMPMYSDEQAYGAVNTEIDMRFANGEISSGEASELFYANQDKYLTKKYEYESIALVFIIGAIYGAVTAGLLHTMRRSGRVVKKDWLYLVAVGSFASMLALYVESLYVGLERQLYPHWADSIGIPIIGALIFAALVLPILLLAVWAVTRGYGLQKHPNILSKDWVHISAGKKMYFILTSILLLLFAAALVCYPDHIVSPIVFGGLLFNYLLFNGIKQKNGEKFTQELTG